MYSDKVIEHFQNPRNVGEIEDYDGKGRVGSLTCGDVMEVYIKVKDGKLEDIKYKTFGCGAAVASGSMGTEMAKGMSLQEALRLTDRDVSDALDGLPPEKMHCSNLVADGIRAAIEDYISRNETGNGSKG
ncbi:MAG: iron-sulfur cluster assembly scaffold protein [Actinomycetota bacterium]|nr:iron-sulfur cluster assembly scaffold protein [Actinomycetota bacterium]